MRVTPGKQQLEQPQPAVGDAPPEFSAHRSGKEPARNNTSRPETKGREGGRGSKGGEQVSRTQWVNEEEDGGGEGGGGGGGEAVSNGNYSLCARKYMEALHASKKDGYTLTIYVYYILYIYICCVCVCVCV